MDNPEALKLAYERYMNTDYYNRKKSDFKSFEIYGANNIDRYNIANKILAQKIDHKVYNDPDSEYEEYEGKYIIEGDAKAAARVVYNYYGGAEKFKRVSEEIMLAVDKGDSADFTEDEILHPTGWVLMNFLMDARTGLGRFREFRISNYDLMMELIDYCVDHDIDQVLELPDVKERVDMYFEQQELFVEQLKRITKIHDKVAVIDLRNEETIYTGNRFMVYALWPEVEISVHVAWGFRKQNTAVMIGKSIINKSSNFNIGELCLSYGGGGHANAGTCQLENDVVDGELPTIISKLNGN
jgi:nanoRNase/pAp phosphatase (c-di-AMP/oligoRNAs hydrolase)